MTQQSCEKGTTHSSNNLKGGREDILGNKRGVKKTLPFEHHAHPSKKEKQFAATLKRERLEEELKKCFYSSVVFVVCSTQAPAAVALSH